MVLTFGPEHEGREAERLEHDRTRQKVLSPLYALLICSIGKVASPNQTDYSEHLLTSIEWGPYLSERQWVGFCILHEYADRI